jgi:hypothetical protein
MLTIASCGGGGGSSTSSTSSFSGTAAIGAPISSATVNVYDKSGVLVGTTTTDASGAYTLSNVASTNGPFVIEVAGSVGDSNAKFYAVTSAGGVANVNQVSNAIATTLSSSGAASSLVSGNNLSSSQITTSENVFTDAFANLMGTFNVSGSLVTQAYTNATDNLLDHIRISVQPDGKLEISSSQGEKTPDIMGDGSFAHGTDTPVTHKINVFDKGVSPSSADSNNIPALDSGVIATAKSLETLRVQLEACFSHAASSRATQSATGNNSPNWTSINSDCQDLAVDNAANDAFKHESYYWIDNLSQNSTTIKSGCITQNAYCLGFFGSMLTDSNYDNIKFLAPMSITPVNTNIWKVQFPIVYSDGSRGQFGDVVGTNYAVIKYDSTAQKFKFLGNQRDVMTTILPSSSLIQKAGTNNYRIEVGLNIFVSPYSSRSLKKSNGTPVYPVKARVQPVDATTGMLPSGGVYLANKTSTTTVSGGVSSSKALRFNVCSYMNFEDPSLISNSYYAGTANAARCSGVITMNYKEYVMTSGSLVATPGAYSPLSTNLRSWISDWASNGTVLPNQPLVTTATAKKGERYLFTLTMSDGTTIKYVNRLTNSTMTVDQAALLSFPTFTTDMSSAMANFNGGASTSLTVNWNTLKTAFIFQDALFWNTGELNQQAKVTVGSTTNSISCPTSSVVIAGTNYQGDAVNNILNCQETLVWKSSTASNPDGGILQLKARTYDGLFIQSQLRQF